MALKNGMIRTDVLKKEVELNNLMVEMNLFLKNVTKEYEKTDEYKNKYQDYLKRLEALKLEEEYYDEEEIDVVKHKHNPYLKLKYWISEYTTSYKKVLKPQYIGVKEKLDIKLDVTDIDKLINELDEKISLLKDEEKVNYVFNLDEIITKELK